MTDDTLRAALKREFRHTGAYNRIAIWQGIDRVMDALAASAPDEVSAAALRLALRTEMGWSVHEVEEFLGQYHLTKPLDEYDSQRIDGEYAALASAPDEGPREEFNERWCPNGCGAVLAPNTTHYDGADGYVCRPAAPVALQEQPE